MLIYGVCIISLSLIMWLLPTLLFPEQLIACVFSSNSFEWSALDSECTCHSCLLLLTFREHILLPTFVIFIVS